MEIDKKLGEAYTLFKRHILLLEKHYERQNLVIHNFELAYKSKTENTLPEILDIFNYVYLFVDLSARLKKIVPSIPKLNQRGKEHRLFFSSLGNLTELRNRFQHINEHIAKDETDDLLGTISWFNSPLLYTISLPDVTRQRSSSSMDIEVTADQKLNMNKGLCYILSGEHFDLDSIYKACIALCEYIDSKIEINNENGEVDIRKKYCAMVVSLKEEQGGVRIEIA